MSNHSNRYRLVEREHLTGSIDGIDFGSNILCLARSPERALLWSGGGGYWNGRGQPQAYDPSHLIAFWRPGCPRLDWRRLGEEGGRLSEARIRGQSEPLRELFADPEVYGWIVTAFLVRKTLLIEGGGEAFPLKRS